MVGCWYVLELDLKTELFHEYILEKRFEIGRKLSNQVKSVLMKQLESMKKDVDYQYWLSQKKSTNRSNQLKRIREGYNLSITGAEKIIQNMGKHFLSKMPSKKQINNKKKSSRQKVHLDSTIVRSIAKDAWRSVSEYLFGKAKKVHFKKFGQFNTLKGKTNMSGIRYVNGQCLFNGLKIPVLFKKNDHYLEDAFHDEIAFCRIKKQIRRSKTKYILQIVFKGIPPVKKDKSRRIKHEMKKGDVGLDIGISTLAIVSKEVVRIEELCEGLSTYHKHMRRLNRKLDRSRRATNIENYHQNGTFKKGNHKWVRSKNYMKTLYEVKEIERKIKVKRRMEHNKTANRVLTLGDTIFCEKMSFKGFQKGWFGKRIGLKAPSMFLDILNQKLGYLGKGIHYVETWSVKASQYDPYMDKYRRKRLSERFHTTGDGFRIQRDCFSAWLIKNVNKDLTRVDRDKCLEEFEKFYENYQRTASFFHKKIKKKSVLPSMGF